MQAAFAGEKCQAFTVNQPEPVLKSFTRYLSALPHMHSTLVSRQAKTRFLVSGLGADSIHAEKIAGLFVCHVFLLIGGLTLPVEMRCIYPLACPWRDFAC